MTCRALHLRKRLVFDNTLFFQDTDKMGNIDIEWLKATLADAAEEL